MSGVLDDELLEQPVITISARKAKTMLFIDKRLANFITKPTLSIIIDDVVTLMIMIISVVCIIGIYIKFVNNLFYLRRSVPIPHTVALKE